MFKIKTTSFVNLLLRLVRTLPIFTGRLQRTTLTHLPFLQVIDDSLPFLPNGQLVGVFTGGNQILWPPLIEKAVSCSQMVLFAVFIPLRYMKLMGGYGFPGS